MALKATIEEVSDFNAWEDPEGEPWDAEEFARLRAEFLGRLDQQATEALKAALRELTPGVVPDLRKDGFDFYAGDDFDHGIPPLGPAVALSKDYRGLTITGRVDAVLGPVVRVYRLIGRELDEKTAEECVDSYFWRFCLDMTGAKVFEYVFFEGWTPEDDPWYYMLVDMQTVKQYRYPELAEDCAAAAANYLEANK